MASVDDFRPNQYSLPSIYSDQAEKNKRSKKDLEEIIDTYKALYNQNSSNLFRAIKPEEFWRFFVDGNKQKIENGWLGFEDREPGYLLAMMKAFQILLNSSDDLNKVIKTIHLTTTEFVKRTNYDQDSIEKKGSYRRLNGIVSKITGCPIGSENNSEKGLREVLNKINNTSSKGFMPVLAIHYPNDSAKLSYIVPDSVHSMGSIPSQHVEAETQKMLTNLLDTKNVLLIFTYLALDSNKALKENGIGVSESVEFEMTNLINTYHNSIKNASSDYEKVKAIIEFVQECERFHPFFDANTRVFSMIIKNYLFIQNGFPPMICDSNPNRICGYSCDELIPDYIESMKKTLNLARGIEPNEMRTDEIVSKLSAKDKTYFNEFVELARKFQQRVRT